jgi:hypothetical protein
MRFTALWILWIGLTLASHSGMGSGEAVPAAPGTPQRERLLQAREGAWRAWFTNDQERMKAVFPPDTIAINAGQETWDGQKETLAGAQKFAAGGGKLVSLEFPRTEIQRYDNVAVLYSLYRVETETAGRREVQQGRATEVFVLRNGEWINPGWHTDSGK